MLKKILGDACFDISIKEGKRLLLPGKALCVTLCFSNDTEYDLPLSCTLTLPRTVKCDRCEFDVILPAEGNTEQTMVFSVSENELSFCGQSICEIKICDRVFSFESSYELELHTEMAYKCSLPQDNGSNKSNGVLFSRGGTIYANKGERISMQIIALQETDIHAVYEKGFIHSLNLCGKRTESDTIHLSVGCNSLYFDALCDGELHFESVSNDEAIFLDTINPINFVEVEQ